MQKIRPGLHHCVGAIRRRGSAVLLATVFLSACGGSDSPSNRADITPEALAMLQDDLAGLEAQVAMLMQRADITPADLQALQDQVAALMQRADISPADLQALQDQVAMLMQRADITPADLQALEDQVAVLMQRADIAPADLQALEDQVAVLMQRADIAPADLRALEDQVAMLMQRADIAPADLRALQDQVAALMQQLDITQADLDELRSRMPADDGTGPDVTSLGSVSPWLDNTTAEDLLDHWNDSDTLREALGLAALTPTEVSERTETIRELIEGAMPGSVDTETFLRNVDPQDIEIIGERDGVTYGVWKGGPAGTLNIEFDWRFAPDIDSSSRATIERAGKSWSRRLLDDFGTHMVESGRMVQSGAVHAGAEHLSGTYDEEVTTDGVLIVVLHAKSDPMSSGGPEDADITEEDFEPWFGKLQFSQSNIDERGTIGNYWFIHLAAHEIGHVLGITSHEGGWHVPSYERYVNRQDHTFEGPQAQLANGGQPVPFQWLDPVTRQEVPPNTAGAEKDFGHLGVCTSLMAYCNEPRDVYEPSQIDFGFLADIGYEILDAETASGLEIYGYGAWQSYSAWGAGVERRLALDDQGSDVFEVDRLRAGADAFGVAPAMTLGELHSATPQGNMTWTGSLLGVDLGSTHLPPVFGDARISVDIASLEGTASFDNLIVYTEGAASSFRSSQLEYSIEVTGNAFGDAHGHVVGGLFGPGHEEMAGVLEDRELTVNLLAGFGGAR